jgi:hypothetical protein
VAAEAMRNPVKEGPQLDKPGLGGSRPRAHLLALDVHSLSPVFGALTGIDTVDSDDGKRVLLALSARIRAPGHAVVRGG